MKDKYCYIADGTCDDEGEGLKGGGWVIVFLGEQRIKKL